MTSSQVNAVGARQQREIQERKLYVEMENIDKPVLLASDHTQILADSDGQVHARCREHLGTIKLLLKAPYKCSDAVFNAAKEQAMSRIQYNHEHPANTQ